MGDCDQIFFRNRVIPCGTGPQAMIAPFWDSLVDEQVYAYYDEENYRFIVEWSECGSDYNPELKNSFQVIFFDPEYRSAPNGAGELLFQYKEIHDIDANDNYSTIGIENYPQTEGLCMLFAGIENTTAHTLTNETAILFTMYDDPDFTYLTAEPSCITISATSDTLITQELILSNEAADGEDLEFTISLTHFTRALGRSVPTTNRSVENYFIIQGSGAYIPVEPMNMLFYLVHNDPQGEPIHGVRLDFPDGFNVNSATDLADLDWNGETGNGAQVSWGFGNGTDISSGTPISFHVNLTVDESLSGPVEVSWYIEGDGSGAPPHFIEDSVIIQQSDEEFIWIRYPNGGENILPGIQDTIRWNHYGESETVNIEITRDSGAFWEEIASGIPNIECYPYTFTGPLSQTCQLKISIPNDLVSDVSDSLFSISALNVTYPNENSVLSYGEKDSIFWQDIGGIDLVDIDFSADNGFSWSNLATQIPNEGCYEFVIPGPPTEYSIIRLSCQELDVYSYSDQFTIVDSPVEWLLPDITEGSIPSGSSETIRIQCSTADLDYGTYQAKIKIETVLGQVLFVPVTLEYYQPIQPVLEVKLYQNHPNPFNPFTKIEYELPEECKVKLSVFNIKGQLVKTITNETKPSGPNYEYWDGTDKFDRQVSSGIYYYLLKAGKTTKAKKMILVK
jgi:hypothetical protein